MSYRSLSAMVIVLSAISLGISVAPQQVNAQDVRPGSPQTHLLKGTYSFRLEGITAPGLEGGGPVIYAAVGAVTLDGKGGVAAGTLVELRVGGATIPIVGGTYSVGATGLGELDIQLGGAFSGFDITYKIAIKQNGAGFYLGTTNSGSQSGSNPIFALASGDATIQ